MRVTLEFSVEGNNPNLKEEIEFKLNELYSSLNELGFVFVISQKIEE